MPDPLESTRERILPVMIGHLLQQTIEISPVVHCCHLYEENEVGSGQREGGSKTDHVELVANSEKFIHAIVKPTTPGKRSDQTRSALSPANLYANTARRRGMHTLRRLTSDLQQTSASSSLNIYSLRSRIILPIKAKFLPCSKCLPLNDEIATGRLVSTAA